MPTAARTEGLTIGGVLFKTRALDIPRFSGLLEVPEHRHVEDVLAGQAGVDDLEPVIGMHRELVQVRVNGQWTYDSDAYVADPDLQRAEAYTTWQVVVDLVKDTAVKTLELVHPLTTASADCRLLSLTGLTEEDEGPESCLWSANLDVLLPDGPLL